MRLGLFHQAFKYVLHGMMQPVMLVWRGGFPRGDGTHVAVTELQVGCAVVSDRSVWCYMQYCCISWEAWRGKHHIRFKNGRG